MTKRAPAAKQTWQQLLENQSARPVARLELLSRCTTPFSSATLARCAPPCPLSRGCVRVGSRLCSRAFCGFVGPRGAVPSRKVRSMFRRRRGDVAALLESTDARGNSPLLLATKPGRTDIASFLVHQGANVEVPSDEHFHLIDEAVATGDREFVRLVYRRLQLRTYEKFVARCPVRRVKRAARDKIIVARHWHFVFSGVVGRAGKRRP